MPRFMQLRPLVLAVMAGALLGLLCAEVVLVDSGLSLIPWAAAGIAVGWLARARRQAVGWGAAYGFALAYVFMVAGYDGAAPLHTKLVPFLVFGVVGAACGTVLGLGGFVLRRMVGRAREG